VIDHALSAPVEEAAFGAPGQAGDPDRIRALAREVVGVYEALMDWAASLRNAGVPQRFRDLVETTACLVDAPILQIREWIDSLADTTSRLPEIVAGATPEHPAKVEMNLKVEIDPTAKGRQEEAIAGLQGSLPTQAQPAAPTQSAVQRAPEPSPPQQAGFLKRWQAKRQEKAYDSDLAKWQEQRNAHAELLTMAEEYRGANTNEIMLAQGEALFCKVTNVALVEDRVKGGSWQGRSSGVSVPIGSLGGRSVRYRVGASRGHYVAGTPTPTAIDIGTVFVTNQRVIFQGAKQTRECQFKKLIGVQHDDAEGSTTLSVSNRQKPTTVIYGSNVASWFDFRLELALAHFRGTVDDVIAEAQRDLDQIDTQRPVSPGRGA